MLTSYHMAQNWTGRLARSIIGNTAAPPERLNFSVIELDTLRIRGREAQEARLAPALEIMKRGGCALAVVLDDAALELLLDHNSELPPELPIVFAGVEHLSPGRLKARRANLTGVLQNSDLLKTVQLARRLYPDLEEIAVITDDTEPELGNVRKLLAGSGLKITTLSTADHTVSELFELISRLPEKAMLLMTPWHKLPGGGYQSMNAFAVDLAQAARRPYLVGRDALIGYGALGGCITAAETHGREVAALIRRVLETGSAVDEPIITGRVTPVIDARVMLENNLSFSKLPPEVELRNLPPSFWESFRTPLLVSGFLLSLVLTGMIVYFRSAGAADRAKRAFIARVSHELRTPLNAVIGFSELLKSEELSAETRREYLDAIGSSGNVLLQLINDILDLSKLKSGKMCIVPAPVDFAQLADEMLKIFALRAHERGDRLTAELPELPPLELDALRIRQILFNLIGNAVKFTENGEITLRAAFRPENDECGEFELSVTDTGIGIAPEEQSKLTKPFVQLNPLRSGGTGLGLAITRLLAEAMKGSLRLVSQPGCGSTFTVTLKGVRRAPRPLPAVSPETPETPETPQAEPHAPSLLLVDDVPLNLKLMESLCIRCGAARCVAVSSGAEALDRLKNETFDAVLTDLWMPEMDGVELARRINAAVVPAPALIAVTADPESAAALPSNLFSGVLVKPVTPEKLCALCRGLQA